MMDLTTDEIVSLIDSINNSIEDLKDVALYHGDELVNGKIETLDNLLDKLETALEASYAGHA